MLVRNATNMIHEGFIHNPGRKMGPSLPTTPHKKCRGVLSLSLSLFLTRGLGSAVHYVKVLRVAMRDFKRAVTEVAQNLRRNEDIDQQHVTKCIEAATLLQAGWRSHLARRVCPRYRPIPEHVLKFIGTAW